MAFLPTELSKDLAKIVAKHGLNFAIIIVSEDGRKAYPSVACQPEDHQMVERLALAALAGMTTPKRLPN